MKKLGINDILETERCILRIPEESEAQEMWNLISENTLEYMTWDKCGSIKEQRKYIQGIRMGSEKGIAWQSSIYLKDGTMLGMLGFPRINKETKTGEIGYWLGEEFQGKGYIIEGVSALIKHIYNETDWENIIIKVNVLNQKSCNVAKSSGFKLDGTLRKHSILKGIFEDIVFYSFTKEDYLSKK